MGFWFSDTQTDRESPGLVYNRHFTYLPCHETGLWLWSWSRQPTCMYPRRSSGRLSSTYGISNFAPLTSSSWCGEHTYLKCLLIVFFFYVCSRYILLIILIQTITIVVFHEVPTKIQGRNLERKTTEWISMRLICAVYNYPLDNI